MPKPKGGQPPPLSDEAIDAWARVLIDIAEKKIAKKDEAQPEPSR